MVHRESWVDRLESAWRRRSVVWLAGVRRVGKTYLSRSLQHVEYFDCELPRTRRMLDDPEEFLANLAGKRVVLDEVHRLQNPSEVMKISADHYPDTRLLATGSSTLEASTKFRDTLVGRKENVWLTPMSLADLHDFGHTDLTRRFLHGGLPPFFLADAPAGRAYQEWMDAYWAKDVQELFRLERRASFQRFVELLFVQSGGMFEATSLAAPSEVSRQTIMNYLSALEETFVAHVVRPFSTRRSTEIVAAPKVYAFDTGFVCYHRGWDTLRPDDYGILWEHFVLNEIHAARQVRDVSYWRNKNGAEVDFVLARRRASPIAIECKWKADAFDEAGLLAFRRLYPAGANYVVARDVERSFTRSYGDVRVAFVGLPELVARLSA